MWKYFFHDTTLQPNHDHLFARARRNKSKTREFFLLLFILAQQVNENGMNSLKIDKRPK